MNNKVKGLLLMAPFTLIIVFLVILLFMYAPAEAIFSLVVVFVGIPILVFSIGLFVIGLNKLINNV